MAVEIYGLCHPVTGELRYIGKANNAAKRLGGHLRDSRRRDTPVYRWIRKLSTNGISPKVIIMMTVSESQWKVAEMYAIQRAREVGARLLNVAEGGDQPFCSRETKVENGKRNPVYRRMQSRIGFLIRDIQRSRVNGDESDIVVQRLRETQDRLHRIYEKFRQHDNVLGFERVMTERFSWLRSA